MLGQIKNIEILKDMKINPLHSMNGSNGGRLGLSQMINACSGYDEMDGYKVETDKHTFLVLIDNAQSCCESWGYFSSEDNLENYIGSQLKEIKLTDKALNQQVVEKTDYYEDNGGIQFVDFITDKGTFQIAVYNAHNGYYGHGIIVAKDDDILLNDSL